MEVEKTTLFGYADCKERFYIECGCIHRREGSWMRFSGLHFLIDLVIRFKCSENHLLANLQKYVWGAVRNSLSCQKDN